MVSVIIVNYNGLSHLKRCLSSLFKTDYDSFEVIVVDNGSNDGSCAWLRSNYSQVQVIALQRNIGFGKANSLGVKAASGRYVAFLNSDTVVTAGWLTPMVRAIRKRTNATAVCSLLRLLKAPNLLNAAGGGMSWTGYGYDRFFRCPHEAFKQLYDNVETLPVFFPTAAAMLMRRLDFELLGGFDRRFFMYHEDVDLGWRIWLCGGEVHVCLNSVVYHLFGGTTRRERKATWRARMGMRHNVCSLLKCYGKRRLLFVLYFLITMWLRKHAFAEMANVLGWNLIHLPGTLIRRWHIQRGRKISDDELLNNGLITQSEFPPESPMAPVCRPEKMERWHIASPRLSLGRDSSEGRLGVGWYRPQSSHGKPCRLTSGHAVCYLKLSPSCKGRLDGEALLPEAPPKQQFYRLAVSAGGNTTHVETKLVGGWVKWSMDVEADEKGLLKIDFDSPLWSPAHHFGWLDPRWFGCGIGEIVFTPLEKGKHHEKPKWRSEDFSIIIPTFNRRKTLARALRALETQTISGFEVIVVDDGSSDGTWEMLLERQNHPRVSNFDLKVARQENLGGGQARNRGLELVCGRLVMFIGDDILLEPDCLARHLAAHEAWNQNEDSAVLGLTKWDPQSVKATPFLEFINNDGPQFGYGYLKSGEETPFTCFYTSNISLAISSLEDKPFNPEFDSVGWEDTELGYRLVRQGLRIFFCQRARGNHAHPMTLKSFCERQVRLGQSIEIMLRICPEIVDSPYLPVEDLTLGNSVKGFFLPFLLPFADFLDQYGSRPLSIDFCRTITQISFLKGRKKSRSRRRKLKNRV